MGNLLQITNSPNAIINWQSFSIGTNEITRFIQQSNSSAVLNRVTSQDPSRILGTLQSKLSDGVTTGGRVFLINPNGIVFGAGSQVDVGSIVASSLRMSDADFLNGRMRFTDGLGKAVENYGNIGTTSGGNVYLVGAAVTNSGIITTPKGEVVLAAGSSVELVNPGTPNLRVEIVAPDNQARNLGQIVADAGRVGIYAGIINHSGTIRADSAQTTEDGRIVLKATKHTTLEAGSVTTANGRKGGTIEIQSGDTTLVTGKVEATGSAGKGGTVHVLGEQVGLIGDARIDVSGATGGGTVLVGGDFQGKNPEVQNALRTVIGSNASIAADAIAKGDGGKVIVWSDEMTRAYGAISARGGRQSGDGGLVEVSSKGWLDFHAKVDTRAPKGKSGTLLLDPTNIEIVASCCGGEGSEGSFSSSGDPSIFQADFRPGGSTTPSQITWADIDAQLASTNVVITTSDNDGNPGQAGNISVLAAGNYNRPHYLQLVAHNNINVDESITNNGSGEIRMFAGWNGADAVNPSVNGFSGGTISLNAPVSTTGNMVLVAGDSINQTADARVTAATLWAESVFGNVNMHLAPNRVDTLAGRAGNELFSFGGTFRFRNAQALIIGSHSRGSGIRVDGGEGSGSANINVNVTSGNLTVNEEVRAQSSGTGTATVTLSAANRLHVGGSEGEVVALGGAGRDGTVNLSAGAGGIRVDGVEGIRATGGHGGTGQGGAGTINMTTDGDITIENVFVQATGGPGDGGGGAARIDFSAAGATDIQGASIQARGATATGSEGSTGGAGRILMHSDGTLTIEGGSRVEALGGDGITGRGGLGEISLTAGNLIIRGGSIVWADGGEGSAASGRAGGAGRLSLLSPGNITVAGAEGMGAFGGNGRVGGEAVTVFSAGGAMSIEDTNGIVISRKGSSGQGIFAVAGAGLHDGATGGHAGTGLAADGSVSIARSHIEAIAGSADADVPDGVGGTAALAVNSRDGNITIVGTAPGTFIVAGGAGLLQGGSAEGSMVAAGNVSVTGELIEVTGGAASTGSGGTSAFAVGAGGDIHFLDTHVLSSSGTAADATIGFLAGGNITVEHSGSSTEHSILAFAGSGAADRQGGSSSIHLKAVAGNIDIINDEVVSRAGNSSSGAGGNGTLTFEAGAAISSRGSHIEAAGGSSEAAGGKGTVNFSTRDRIEVTGAGGGTDLTVLARGGSSSSSSGLGAAEIVMQITSPTGELVVHDDTVHAIGGRLGENGPFGPASITLKFPGRSEGGFSVNGVDGAISGSSSSFGFLVNGETAIRNQNFFVEYGSSSSITEFDGQGQGQVLAGIDRLLQIFREIPEELENEEEKKEICD
jgi:filamentous hemagglutinin family protein